MDGVPNIFLSWAQGSPQLKHHVAQCVVLGNRQLANNDDKLRSMRVTAVLNCGAGKCNDQGGTLRCLKLKLRDDPKADLLGQLEEATQFIEDESKKGVVLVHCMGGFSRSPAVVAAWLIRFGGLTLDEALDVIRVKRSCAQPNEGFMKQLRKWEARHK